MTQRPFGAARVAAAIAMGALALAAASAAQDDLGPTTVLHAGKLFDSKTGEIAEKQTITVQGGVIQSVEDGYRRAGRDETLIDLSDQTVLPGLMDMHVHLLGEQSPNSTVERFTSTDADMTINGVVFANKTLRAGFTTVRDVGGEASSIVALRSAINRGKIPGPRIFAATTPLASTGGHGDGSNGRPKGTRGNFGPAEGVVNSVADARKAVRRRYQEGADLIKITATGGVLSLAKNGQNPQFTEEEIRAIVDTASDYGFMVAAHAHGTEGIKRAIRGGVTTIEHGTYMDDEAMQLMKEYGTVWVPTISAGEFVADKAKIDGYFPDIIRPKAAAIGPVIKSTFERAVKAGVDIAFGTDCGVCPHGSNAKEFGLMVEAGMPAAQALQSATMRTAKLLGLDDRLGSIEAGKIADIVAVDGDPMRNMGVMEDVVFVMKDGIVHRNDDE